MSRAVLHLALHGLLPLVIALLARGRTFARPLALMLATMAVDLDHLLADPVYDPDRCGIGYHPLHEPVLFPLYLALAFPTVTRWVGIGLVVHMALDGIDCLWMG